jgi:hypothetical protein
LPCCWAAKVGEFTRLSGAQDQVREKCQESDVVGANKACAVEKFLIIQEGDLSLHFVDSVCDGHKNCLLGDEGLIMVNPYDKNVTVEDNKFVIYWFSISVISF